MKNISILLLLAGMVAAPKPMFTSQHVIQGNRYLQGETNGYNGSFRIVWRGALNPNGVDARDIIDATIEHIQKTQSTDMGSNDRAKALSKLIEANDILKGSATVGGELNSLIPEVSSGNTK